MVTLKEAIGATTTSAWNTTTSTHVPRKTVWPHMSFYWGHNCEVLFSGWPGSSKGMYAVALVFVFSLAVLVEWFSNGSVVKPGANKVAVGFFKTGFHAVGSGFRYMVMLAVMSFNGGIFLAAVLGHAFGFALFRSRICRKSDRDKGSDKPPSDLPTTK